MTHLARHILIVDDNPGDLALTTEAFQECGFQGEFSYAMTGSDAIDRLGGTGPYVQAPGMVPDLIVLDINLPHRSGLEVLAFIRKSVCLAQIPTVILSTSRRPIDINQARALRVDDYLVKPSSWDQLLDVIRPLERFLAGPAIPHPVGLR